MKILIVDDSSFVNLVCRQALERSGYQVVGEAFDGVAAVELANELQPEVILMDIALPKKNGLEATTEILTSHPQIKIIAMSALDEIWVNEKTKEVGCVSFLAKPFTSVDLIKFVEEAATYKEKLKYG